MSLHSLGIVEAHKLLTAGEINSQELVASCLERIQQFDGEIQAWAHLNPDYALQQAGQCDARRRKGKSPGRLHGIPIAIKDIIDVALLPTENGSDIFKGNIPKIDAQVTAKLKQQGAVIMGKTVTTELATFSPGKTRNPHHPGHTPGGSSSGSAAAVASYMVTGALGTQTNGSVIRPASFCGTVGYKPSYGLISRRGILRQSPFLDQVGVFTRSVADAALLAEILIGADPMDPSTSQTTVTPALLETSMAEPPLPPRLAMVKTAAWDKANSDTQAGFEQVGKILGDQVSVVELPAEFDGVWEHIKTVNEAEMATYYDGIYTRGKSLISSQLCRQIERGQAITAKSYLQAKEKRRFLNQILNDIFLSFDTIITPSAPGEAPGELTSTGDPCFCTPWNFCGLPAVNLPLLEGENGLPIGVQLVGQDCDDARLLRTANWLNKHLTEVET